ncbi:unnamed protein product [Prorocentrum cordatum]|uniref:Apple domain-containing protein n=1 Tax=Prorocentrum cordatum TaxID=2364126 RepID=A0ABN9UEB0_9DINO|nr:unnamed protein product [Polarella glacialis]
MCCACGGGDPPTSKELWWSVGVGLCSGHEDDWTKADDLGANWGSLRGYGWRFCDQYTDEQCKAVCAETEDCTMVSNNGFCCFLFKGSTCGLDDTKSDYETFSNSVSGTELCTNGCAVGTKCYCQAHGARDHLEDSRGGELPAGADQ